MKKIITAQMANVFSNRNDSEILNELLVSDHHLARSHAAINLGSKLQAHDDYKEILIKQMNNDVQFENVRFGIKSAWTIAVVLAENLKEKDYPRLKEAFDKWDIEEKEGLLDWLKDNPDHIKILTGKNNL